MVLSLRVPLCDRQMVNGSPIDQLRRRHLLRRLDWSPWLRAPSLIVILGRGPSSTSTPISIKIMEESSRDPGGSTSTLPSGGRAVFLDSELVSAATASSGVVLTISLVGLCGIGSTTTLENFVEFRWRNLWQSAIYRSPVKYGRESGRVYGVVSSF